MIGLIFSNPLLRWGVIVAGSVAALVAFTAWQRADAVADYKRELRAMTAEQRIKDIRDAKEARDEVESLDDCTLLGRLLSRVRGADGADGAAVSGCGDTPATDEGGNGAIPRPQ